MNALVEIKDYSFYYRRGRAVIPAVNRVTLDIGRRAIMGLAGESGCGKTTLGLSIPQLIYGHTGIGQGTILFEGRDVVAMTRQEKRCIRGSKIAVIFQDPFTALNPVLKIGYQLEEVLLVHACNLNRAERQKRIEDMLRRVRFTDAQRIMMSYPHQLSGGMRQRCMIAMALLGGPSLIIADEPTTALDAQLQREILDLLRQLAESFGLTLLIITHDLAALSYCASGIAIMYAGSIVEKSPAKEIFKRPLHPYTWGLINSMPLNPETTRILPVIPGEVPDPGDYPQGCPFHPRCAACIDICRSLEPVMRDYGAEHHAACHRAGEWEEKGFDAYAT